MMIRNILLTAVAGVVLAAAPAAHAADAFTSFDGTQGAGGFFYGQVGSPFSSSPFVPFTTNTNCFIAGSVCLQQAPNFDVPGVTKSTMPSFQYGSVNVPTDRLLLHPSIDGSQKVVVLYSIPTAGQYTFKGTYNVQDVNPSGVNVGFYNGFGLTPIELIDRNNPSGAFSVSLFRNQGDLVGFTFDNAGFYGNDSTGFNFSVSVPEPATWGMMILGFGVVGGALRTRRRQALATA